MSDSIQLHAVRADGTEFLVDARALRVRLDADRELTLRLHDRGLSLRADAVGDGATTEGGRPARFAALVLRPGACNVVDVTVHTAPMTPPDDAG